MPYSQNSSNLPSYVKKLSAKNKAKWISIFNAAHKKYGESKAFLIANTWLKKNVKKQETKVRTTHHMEKIEFIVDDSEELIKRTDDGEDYIDFIMTDNLPDKEGVTYPMELLQKWEDQINSGDILVGDFDHEEYDRLLEAGYGVKEIIKRLKNKSKSIAKTFKAVLKEGKLWVRAVIDKRYKKLIKEKAKGVSLEASLIRDDSDNIIDGTLGGFTFALKHSPYNERAVIA